MKSTAFLPTGAARRLRAPLACAALFSLGAAGCGAAASPRPASRPEPAPLALEACAVPGVAEPLRCGTYTVFEDREARAGRTIGLRVVVAPARGGDPASDPVWVLAGGPGQGAAELTALLLPALEGVRQDRDVVLMDQRGTGRSNGLSCEGGFALLESGRTDGLKHCRAELERRADLRFYTTPLAVDDMEEVRRALGYGRLNLVGVSYGTRAAQVYLRRHPRSVRSAVLRAVLPMGGNISMDGTTAADRQLTRLVDDCAADEACGAAFPRLRVELDSVARRLAIAPARIVMAPAGGADSATLEITPGLFYQTLYALMLSTPTRQQIPLLVSRAAAGQWQALAPLVVQVRAASYGTVPVGMYLSVVCSEDVPRITPAQAEWLRSGFGGFSAGLEEVCARWPRGTLPAGYHEPLRTDAPLLLLSGDVDPATAAEPAEAWARSLPRARHVTLPATAHGPLFPGCAAELVARFVAAASAAELDPGCVAALEWPPFALPSAPRP